MSSGADLVYELQGYSIAALTLWPLVATFASFDPKDGEAEFNPRFNLLVGGTLIIFILFFYAIPMALSEDGVSPLSSLRNKLRATIFFVPGFLVIALQYAAINLMPEAGNDPSAKEVRSLNYWIAVIIILVSCVWLYLIQNGDSRGG